MTSFWRFVRYDRPLLPGNNIFEKVFQRRIAEADHFDVIVVSTENVRSVDVDIRETLVQRKNGIIDVILRTQQSLLFARHSHEDQ